MREKYELEFKKTLGLYYEGKPTLDAIIAELLGYLEKLWSPADFFYSVN